MNRFNKQQSRPHQLQRRGNINQQPRYYNATFNLDCYQQYRHYLRVYQ
jgi:hypothetical protein